MAQPAVEHKTDDRIQGKSNHLWPTACVVNQGYASAFSCVKCNGLPKVCMNNEEGKILCSECAREQENTTASKAVQNLVNQLKTKCLSIIENIEATPETEGSNVLVTQVKDNQCDWTGMLQEWEEHSLQCPYVCVICNECNKFQCQRKAMQKHIEKCPEATINCPLTCGLSILRKNSQTHVNQECMEKLLDCSNDDCKMQIKRKDLENHMNNECDGRIVACEFVKYGCDVKQIKACELKSHMKEYKFEHLSKQFHFVSSELIQENKKLKEQFDTVSSELIEENKKLKETLLPKGSIIMWSGTEDNIPKGWLLCNGENNTPDLRNRFVIGAGDEYKTQSSGGCTSHGHNVTVQGHALTVQEMPTHSHTLKMQWKGSGKGGSVCSLNTNDTGGTNWDGREWTNDTGSNQEHTHAATASTVSNVPPYYAMCFIMKR